MEAGQPSADRDLAGTPTCAARHHHRLTHHRTVHHSTTCNHDGDGDGDGDGDRVEPRGNDHDGCNV